MGAAQEAVKLVEAALQGMIFYGVAKMPFAHERGFVAGRVHAVGESGFAEWQSEDLLVGRGRLVLPSPPRLLAVLAFLLLLLFLRAGIEFVPEPLLISAGQEPGSGGRAVGTGDITAGAAHARVGQGVQVRRGNLPTALHAEITVSHVVADDDDNIGLS